MVIDRKLIKKGQRWRITVNNNESFLAEILESSPEQCVRIRCLQQFAGNGLSVGSTESLHFDSWTYELLQGQESSDVNL